MYCCAGLENLVGNAGERGIAVLVRVTKDGIRFVLQSRGVAHEDEGKLQPMPLDINVNISCNVGLRYCPFCGRRLAELVESDPKSFNELLDDHAVLL